MPLSLSRRVLAPRKRSRSPPSGSSTRQPIGPGSVPGPLPAQPLSTGRIVVSSSLLTESGRSVPGLACLARANSLGLARGWTSHCRGTRAAPISSRCWTVGRSPATGRCHDGCRRPAPAHRCRRAARRLASAARRTLAGRLAVSRTTATQALDELRGEGRVPSRQGSGTYVAGPASPPPFATRVAEHLSSGPGIDLAKGDAPDLSHLPRCSSTWRSSTCPAAAQPSTPPGSR